MTTLSQRNHDTDIAIGGRVRSARLLAGMSQEALADKLGITFQQVQKYEKGANRVAASTLIQVAEITGQPVGFFYPSKEEVGAMAGFDRADIDLVRQFQRLSSRTKRSLMVFAAELDREAA